MESPLVEQPSLRRKKMTKQLTGKRDDAPLHSAARAGNLSMVIAILSEMDNDDLRKSLSRQNQAGETALYVTCEYGYVDVVNELMKHYDASSAGIKAKNGYDPLHIAAKQGDAGKHVELLTIFLPPRLGSFGQLVVYGFFISCRRLGDFAEGYPGAVHDR